MDEEDNVTWIILIKKISLLLSIWSEISYDTQLLLAKWWKLVYKLASVVKFSFLTY